MELMVYIAIMGIVVLVAGQAFSDSTKMRIRTQSMVKANEIAGNIATLIKDDIAQMGAKSSIDKANSSSNADAFFITSDVYIDPDNLDNTKKDSSSYKGTLGTNADSLIFRKIKYTDAGVYQRVEEITWYLQGNKLFRACKTISGTADNDQCPSENSTTVEIADGVTKFKVIQSTPSILGNEGRLFPSSSDLSNKKFKLLSRYGSDNYARVNTDPNPATDYVRITGFISNYREDGASVSDPIKHQLFAANHDISSDTWSNCTRVVIDRDTIYELSFAMTNSDDESRMFRPGIDHMAVGLRKVDGTGANPIASIPDYMFYPPENDNGVGTRSVKFSSNENRFEACIAFTFAFFSPTVGMGAFTITDLQLRKVGDMSYKFKEPASIQITDKKNVRAFQTTIEVKKNGEAGSATIAIPVPSNGIRG